MAAQNDVTPRRRHDLFAELADAIERAWLSRWSAIPVVARAVIDRIRRGNP